MKIVDGRLVDFKIEDIAYTDELEKKIIVKVPNGVKIIPIRFLGREPIDKIYLPDSVKTIEESAFDGAFYLEKIEGMKGVTKIDNTAFYGTNIKSIECPPHLKTIGDFAFKRSFLSKITFNDELTSIGKEAFCDSNIQEVKLPESITHIGDGAFSLCENLNKISIPSKINSLPNAFCSNSSIEKINIPKNVKVIGEGCFCDCEKLGEVNFEGGVKTIANEAFLNCDSLTNIDLPDSVERLGASAFEGTGITEITLPPNIVYLGPQVFSECFSLENATINDKVEAISDEAFFSCRKLNNVKFGKNLKVIGAGAFSDCTALEEAILPDGLERLEEYAFGDCYCLKSVRIPDSIKYIGNMAFSSTALEKVYIPYAKDLVIDDKAFRNCPVLREMTIENARVGSIFFYEDDLNTLRVGKNCDLFFIVDSLPWKLKYICKDGDYFVLSETPVGEEYEEISSFNKNLYIGAITKMWDNREKLKSTITKRNDMVFLIDDIYECLGAEYANDFINNARYTFYDQCAKEKIFSQGNLLAYFYNLGGFSNPIKEKRISKKGNVIEVSVDYAQKVGEFFKSLSNLTEQEQKVFVREISRVRPVKFNPEAANFLLDFKNTREIIMEAQDKDNLFKNIVNNFNEVQETNKSRKGSQRQLAPTVERFVEYFNDNKFSGVAEEDRELAKFLSKYYIRQETYDTAVEIKKEKERKGVEDSILGFHLKEDDAFKNIDKLSLNIKKIAGETVDSILDSTTDYTFDWLEKSDPNNYVLGRLCNCCAELESAGFGIMHASIVNPDVQNLVIRDSEGKIIAKSTLYINRKDGYGVFNNLQVAEKILIKDQVKIYKKYKLAIAAFAKEYNALNPENPLKQINVGMRINSLSSLLEEYDKEAPEILDAIDYGIYGRDGNTYNGDSKTSQYIVWEDEK